MPTFTNGTVPTAANLNAIATGINNLGTLLTGVAATRQTIPTASAYINTTHAIPTGVDTLVSYDAYTINEDFLWTPSNGFEVNTAGIYVIWAQINWDYNATGVRAAHVMINGTNPTVNSVAAGSANTSISAGVGTAFLCVSPPLSLIANTPINVAVFQSTGGPLNLIPNESGTSLTVMRVGA
jgi:hypothetical protein